MTKMESLKTKSSRETYTPAIKGNKQLMILCNTIKYRFRKIVNPLNKDSS